MPIREPEFNSDHSAPRFPAPDATEGQGEAPPEAAGPRAAQVTRENESSLTAQLSPPGPTRTMSPELFEPLVAS